MRRLVPLLALAFLLAGCGGGRTVSPTPETVIGSVPTSTQASVPPGDAKAGAAAFKSSGCDGCHVFTPAGSHGTTGPDLDKLERPRARPVFDVLRVHARRRLEPVRHADRAEHGD